MATFTIAENKPPDTLRKGFVRRNAETLMITLLIVVIAIGISLQVVKLIETKKSRLTLENCQRTFEAPIQAEYFVGTDLEAALFRQKLHPNDTRLEDFTDILESFAEIEAKLQAVHFIFDIESTTPPPTPIVNHARKKRQAKVLGKLQQCIVSKDKLIALQNEIETKLLNQSNISCEFDFSTMETETGTCEQLIQLIQCGIEHFKIQFKKAFESQASAETINEMKSLFNDFMQQYNAEIDDLQRSASQEHQQKFQSLSIELQCTLSDLNETRNALEATRDQLNQTKNDYDNAKIELLLTKSDLNQASGELNSTRRGLQDFTKIFEEFGIIEARLEAVTFVYDIDVTAAATANHTRKTRSAPVLGKRTQCTVSKAKLIGLQNEIRKTLTNVSAIESTINCNIDLNITASGNCEQLIRLIQCGINNFKVEFKKAFESHASIGTINEWKNAIDDITQKYNKEIDDLQRSASQEYQQKFDGLRTELQTTISDLNEATEQLHKARTELDKTKTELGQTRSGFDRAKTELSRTKNELQTKSRALTLTERRFHETTRDLNFMRSDHYNKLWEMKKCFDICLGTCFIACPAACPLACYHHFDDF